MLFWLLAILVTVIACASLYYAASGRAVNATAGTGVDAATEAHFKLQLSEIENDAAAGRMGPGEAVAARGELARELLRLKGDGGAARTGRKLATPLAVAATAILAIATYAMLGQPDLPSAPLAERPAAQLTLEDAVARIERQLTVTPDDLRGWTAIAPAYMQLGRFADAERAYRRVLELSGATADSETNLAEALLMKAQGEMGPEARALLESAAARDPRHARSRFYLASEATRIGDYAAAVEQWDALIGMAAGDEGWLDTARAGLAAAQAGLSDDAPPSAADIAAMVDGLSARLMADGGSIEEWTQLVRSRLVLGDDAAAQAAYDAARAAYPDANTRAELDRLAADNGLVAK